MAEPIIQPNPNADNTDATTKDSDLIDGAADKGKDADILDQAEKDVQAKQASEDKRLLEIPDDKLSEDDKPKKAEALKRKEAADKAATEKAKAESVPEKYEIKLPEGITLDQALMDRITPKFKEAKLTQSQAQAVVDIYTQIQKDTQKTAEEAFNKFVKDSREETLKTLGANANEELAYAAKARQMFLTPETVEELKAAGLTNSKNLILDLIKIGKQISETKVIDGKSATSGIKSPADIFYNK